jgi:hypothetical protein
MTSKRDDVERKRDELRRGAVGRRLSLTINARRLNRHGPGIGRTSASPFGPRDPRYEYLTQPHD